MALTDFPIIHVPAPSYRHNGLTFQYQTHTLDAAAEKACVVLRAPKTGNISEIGFVVRSVSVNGAIDARVETVDATNGQPTGTLWATTTNGSATVNAANTWFTATLTSAAAVTKGTDEIAIVLSNTSGNFQVGGMTTSAYADTYPYGVTFLNSVWAKGANTPCVALKYDDATYPWLPGVLPASGVNASAYNSGSSPLEKALKFQFPMQVRAIGCWVYADFDGTADVKLYDASSNALSGGSISMDPDVRGTVNPGYHEFYFPTAQTLSAATVYRLAVVPTSGTNITIGDWDATVSGIMDGQPGGANFQYSSRPSAGSWTDLSTKKPLIGLIVDQIDTGSSGGLKFHPGMQGGCNA